MIVMITAKCASANCSDGGSVRGSESQDMINLNCHDCPFKCDNFNFRRVNLVKLEHHQLEVCQSP
jgi:hypothetical protein